MTLKEKSTLVSASRLEQTLFELKEEEKRLEKIDNHTEIGHPVIQQICISGYKGRLKVVKAQIAEYKSILEAIDKVPEDYQ